MTKNSSEKTNKKDNSLTINSLEIAKRIEKIRLLDDIHKKEWAISLGFKESSAVTSYNNAVRKGTFTRQHLQRLKIVFKKLSMEWLFTGDGEMFISEEKIEIGKDFSETLKILLERNEQKAVQIDELKKELKEILEGKR